MNFIDLADDICAVPIDVRDGRFAPPSTPGIGIEVDEDKLTHYRLDDPVSGPGALARA
jgi:L-alanine-DL-glutamate epimerase-like enolase superfamily enzyme